MKIIFLCNSLEQGCDGVGDYTRLLACELISKGHTASAIALNDKFTSVKLESIQKNQNCDLQTQKDAPLPSNPL